MSTHHRRHLRWIAVLGIGALALTACGDPVAGRAVAGPASSTNGSGGAPSTVEDPDLSPSTTSSSASSASSSPSSSSPSSSSSSSSSSSEPAPDSDDPEETTDEGSAPIPSGDETAPGTTLALTDSATFAVEESDEVGVFTFSNIQIAQGTAEDWAKLDPEEGTGGLLPWYISVTITQVSGPLEFEYSDLGYDIKGVTDQGRELEAVYLGGNDVGCASGSFEPGYALGDSYTSCVVWQTDDRAKVVQLEYQGDYDGPYYDSPVVWTVG